MADEAANLLVRITADGSQAIGVLNQVAASAKVLANGNAGLMTKMESVGALAGKVGMAITKTVGVATVTGLVASAKAAGQLNKELANIGTLSVPTERLMKFKGQIQDIAVATGKNTSDISEGTYQVVSAFGDAADTMEKVEINAKAARAGLATTSDSINLTSAVTKAYGDTSAQAVQHVADLAFKTVELGQTTFPELASSMQQVTSLSKELGVSQEELFASYATLTGVTGNAAEVQTQIKAIYTALLKPSDNMAEAINKQGYESGYAMIKAKGFAGTLEALKEATGGSEEAMLGLFNNVRAMPAIMALTGAQSDTFAAKLGKMKEASGAATKAFEIQTEGLAKTGFTLEQAKEKMQVAAQNFGESAAPLIADFAGVVENVSTKLSEMSDEERRSIIDTGVLTTKIGLGLAVGGKAITMGTKLVGTVKAVGGTIGAIPLSANLAVAGIVGLTAATVAGIKAYEAYQESQLNLLPDMEQGIEKVNTYRNNIEELNSLQKEAVDLRAKMQDGNSTDEEYAAAAKRLNEIRDILSEKYHLDMDSSDIDAAINKAKTLQQTMAAGEAKQLADSITSDRGQYDQNKSKLSEFTVQKRDFDNLSGAATNAKKSLEDLHTQYQLGAIDEKTYHDGAVGIIKDFNEFSTENTRKEFKKLNETFSADSEYMTDSYGSVMSMLSNIEKGSGRLSQNLQTNIDKYSASVSDYEQKCKQFADNALTWLHYDSQNGDSNAVEHDINNIATAVKNAGLNMDTYAQQAAVAQSEQSSLNEIWTVGGSVLDKAVTDYISAGQKFGMTAQQAQLGAALIKQGFSDIASAAVTDGGLNAVVNSFKELSGQTNITSDQLTQLAREIGILPESKKINISAEGDVTIVDTVEQQVKNLDGKTFAVTVNTECDTSGASEVDEKVKKLDGKKCTVTFTADGTPAIATINGVEYKLTDYSSQTGTATLLAENGQAIGVIDLTTGKIYSIPLTHDTSITAQDNTSSGVESAKAQLNSVKDKSVTITVRTVLGSTPGATIENMPWRKQAQGTQNFPGGLAMVNDQTGISDNRELIIDRGKAFIPQGKNVILPLSRGAKVYTAAQTKAIMSGLGIPHYAAGKDNSDAFTNARDDWTHYTRTHAVTSAQELEKCNQLLKESAQNAKDVADAEEMIYSAQVKVNKELDEASAKYIENRTFNNDWADYGDTPIEAFNRYKERQHKYAAESQLTWEEADKNIAAFGEKLLDGRIQQSLKWIEHQKKYNNMSVEDELAALQTIQSYTLEFYEKGLIQHEKYREQWTEIDERFLDGIAQLHEDEYANWEKSKDNWIRIHDTYDDWDEIGDSLSQVYARSVVRVDELYKKGIISSWQEAEDAKLDYSLKMYEAASDEYDALLAKQSDRIREMQEEFSKQEEELRSGWEVSDRKADMEETDRLLEIYKNAVTGTGRDKYKELLKQKEQLERDEQLYQLQQNNNAVIEKLQTEYDAMEADKKKVLSRLKISSADTAFYAADISDTVSSTRELAEQIGVTYTEAAETTLNALNDIYKMLDKIRLACGGRGGSTYNDRRTITLGSSLSAADVSQIINGVVVTGLGVM